MKAVVWACLGILLITVSLGSGLEDLTGLNDEFLDNVDHVRNVRQAANWPRLYELHLTEGHDMQVNCHSDTKIGIVSATYGDFPCFSDVSEHVDNLCFEKERCIIPVTNEFMGDPCPNRLKDFILKYRCWPKEYSKLVKLKRAIAHENTEMQLTCRPKEKIDVVFAIYGCQFHQSNTTLKVDNLCFNKSSCKFTASNDIFGDSCRGIAKDLHVTYRCWPEEEAPGYLTWLRYEENSEMRVDCPENTYIGIVSAIYGVDRKIGKRRRICRVDVSFTVDPQCFGKQSCKIPATDDFLGFHNRCLGFDKNLQVEYRCWP